MQGYEVIVLGAGLAGAATARALVEGGLRSVAILDPEAAPARHASGLNAGLVRRATEDPAIAPLAREGADEIARLGLPFRRTGSLLLGTRALLPESVVSHPQHRRLAPDDAIARVPLLAGRTLEGIVETPADGVIDALALVRHYLDEAVRGGAACRLGCSAFAPRIGLAGVEGVESAAGFIPCRHLVVATGAWAAEWGRLGGVPVDLVPRRRHLLVARGPAAPDGRAIETAAWPWVWDLEHEFYFRPCDEGLLFSPCDSDPAPPGRAALDSGIEQRLAATLRANLPRAGALEVLRIWAGQRTVARDGRFLLGSDPRLRGWHWAAGLGGHGVTVSSAIGRRVAAGILGTGGIEPEFRARPAVVAAF